MHITVHTHPDSSLRYRRYINHLLTYLLKTVIHNTAQNGSDNLPSYPPDSHHSADTVYWTGGEYSTQSF